MKTKLILLLASLGLAGLCLATPGVYRKTLTLVWDNPPDLDTNCVINIYASTDASMPLAQWTWRTNVPYPQNSVTLPIFPGRQFFAVTTSNYWGESDFSNVATAPGLPQTPPNLRIAQLP